MVFPGIDGVIQVEQGGMYRVIQVVQGGMYRVVYGGILYYPGIWWYPLLPWYTLPPLPSTVSYMPSTVLSR